LKIIKQLQQGCFAIFPSLTAASFIRGDIFPIAILTDQAGLIAVFVDMAPAALARLQKGIKVNPSA
jgi:hypothetical protein